MEWIEIIHLRSFDQTARAHAVDAFHRLAPRKALEWPRAIRLWQRTDLDTDVSIFLYWPDDRRQQSKSVLGLRLAEAFSDFGMIAHSVWRPDDNCRDHEDEDK